MRFNPNIDTGTIMTILTIVVSVTLAYGFLKEQQATITLRTAQLAADAQADRDRTDKSLTDIKSEIREIGKSVNDVKTDVAVLRGRAAADGGGGKK